MAGMLSMSIFGFSCHGSEEIVVASVVIFPTAMSLLFPYYPCFVGPGLLWCPLWCVAVVAVVARVTSLFLVI